MYCMKCGKEVDGNWEFCRHCGTTQQKTGDVAEADGKDVAAAPYDYYRFGKTEPVQRANGYAMPQGAPYQGSPRAGNASAQTPAIGMGAQESNQFPAGYQDLRVAQTTAGGIDSQGDLACTVLDGWKTDWVSFGFGVFVTYAVTFSSAFSYLLTSTSPNEFVFYLVYYICFSVFAMPYAAIVYPSLFTPAPKLKSNSAVSFLNGLFGSFFIIFGWIWCRNLSKRKKGVSHKVFVGILVGYIALSLVGVMASVSYSAESAEGRLASAARQDGSAQRFFNLSANEASYYFESNPDRVAYLLGTSVPFGWTLRTPGTIDPVSAVADVESNGRIDMTGDGYYTDYGVRPAMWVRTKGSLPPQ